MGRVAPVANRRIELFAQLHQRRMATKVRVHVPSRCVREEHTADGKTKQTRNALPRGRIAARGTALAQHRQADERSTCSAGVPKFGRTPPPPLPPPAEEEALRGFGSV